MYANPSEPCTSVPAYVKAGSLCGSEAVRRFLRLALKQPAKTQVIKTNQLPSAEKVLFFLCPAALPANRVAASNEFEKFKMAALYKVLDRIWAMDQSVIELARAVLKRIRHVLSTNIGNSRPVHRDAADVATAAHVRAWLDGMLPPVVDIPGGVANRGGGGDGHSEDSSEGGS
eukprot:contig_1832_g294